MNLNTRAERLARGSHSEAGFNWRIWLVVGFSVIFLSLTAASAQAQRRGSYNSGAIRQQQQQGAVQAALAQLAAAKEVLAAAESSGKVAQSSLDEAVSKLQAKSKELTDAQTVSKDLSKRLADLEKEIVTGAAADSAYGKAVAEQEAARKARYDVEVRIVGEAEVQSALAGLTGAAWTERKQSILAQRPDYMQANKRLEAANEGISRQRRELLEADKTWQELSESLAKAHKDERAVETQNRVSPRQKTDATKKLQSSSEAAAAAKAAIAQAEAVLKANGGSKYLKSDTPTKKSK